MSITDAALLRHHFTVHLEAAPNALARLVAPFVIHDVLPHRVESVRGADGLTVGIEFTADADIARRLADRLTAMVSVFDVTSVALDDAAAA